MSDLPSSAGSTTLSVPVADLRRWHAGGDAAVAFAGEIAGICHEIGFFVLEHHGVETSLFDDVRALMRDLFALPDEVKSTIDKRRSPHLRGWEAIGSETTNGRTDVREQVDLWTELAPGDDTAPPGNPAAARLLRGPNQWFADDVLPGSRALVDRWRAALADVADDVLHVLSTGLGLSHDHLSDVFGGEQMSLLKLIRYPPTPDGGAGVNAHHDTGFVTILAAGDTPGLQVEAPDGKWLDVAPSRYGLVVNLGEMLQAMTGNYFVATPHRVISPTERYSTAWFHGPSLDTPLVRLPLDDSYADAVGASPRHRDAGFMAPKAETEAGVGDMASHHLPATYGEQLRNYFVRSYPEIVALHHPELVDDRTR